METTTQKPIHAKPSLYAYYFEALKVIAKDHGFNLVLHGSMARDLDLIAIPWIDDPSPTIDLIKSIADYIGGEILKAEENTLHYKNLPGGRTAYVINLNRGGYKKNMKGDIVEPLDFTPDPEYYIDISVTPIASR